MWKKFKYNLGYILLEIDDWFAKREIFFNWFIKDKENHVSLLGKTGLGLMMKNYWYVKDKQQKSKEVEQ